MKRRGVLVAVGGLVALAASAAAFYLLTLYPAGPPQRGRLALVGATVLMGDDLEPVRNATVLVAGGVITKAGPANTVDIPADARVIDLSGLTVMPGLIDLHVHLGSPALDARQEPGLSDMPRMLLDAIRFVPGHRRDALEHGVTTVRNLGDEHRWITDLRRQIEDGTLEGPRLFVSGPLFTTAGGHPIATFGADPASDLVRVPSTPAEARSMVRELATGRDRVDLIKVVQDRGGPTRTLEPIPPDVLNAIVAEAHANRLSVVAHWGTFADLAELLAADVDGLEHIDSRDLLNGWPDDLLSELIERDIPITATLTVSEAALPPDVMPGVMATLQRRVREFHDAGGTIVVGSDAARPGVRLGSGLHRELELLVECGLPPREAVRAATVDAARLLGTDHFGVIAAGRAADLLVVDGDPTSDVAVARRPMLVFRDGRIVVDRRVEN